MARAVELRRQSRVLPSNSAGQSRGCLQTAYRLGRSLSRPAEQAPADIGFRRVHAEPTTTRVVVVVELGNCILDRLQLEGDVDDVRGTAIDAGSQRARPQRT